MHTIRKLFQNLPFAHRQPAHPGHCRLIHGHNWSFALTFACRELEPGTNFVIDFGDLKWVRNFLERHFDHTLVLNLDDPELDYLRETLTRNEPADAFRLAKIILVPSCGAEGLAQFVFDEIDGTLRGMTGKRPVWLVSVEAMEDEKNSATYHGAQGGCAHV